MVKENLFGPTATSMKEATLAVKKMDLVFTLLSMVHATKAFGVTANVTARVPKSQQMVNHLKSFSFTARSKREQ